MFARCRAIVARSTPRSRTTTSLDVDRSPSDAPSGSGDSRRACLPRPIRRSAWSWLRLHTAGTPSPPTQMWFVRVRQARTEQRLASFGSAIVPAADAPKITRVLGDRGYGGSALSASDSDIPSARFCAPVTGERPPRRGRAEAPRHSWRNQAGDLDVLLTGRQYTDCSRQPRSVRFTLGGPVVGVRRGRPVEPGRGGMGFQD